MATGSDPENTEEAYTRSAKGALVVILGSTAAKAVLFYTGEPSAQDFETKLRRVFGPGADIIMRQLPKKEEHKVEERRTRSEGEQRTGTG